MKRLLIATALIFSLAFRPAPAEALIIDASTLAAKISEMVGKIADASTQITTHVSQAKQMTSQGFNKEELFGLAKEYATENGKKLVQEKMKKVVEGTKKKNKDKLQAEQDAYVEGRNLYYDEKIGIVEESIKETRSLQTSKESERDQKRAEVQQKKAKYESVKHIPGEAEKAQDEYMTAQMEYDALDKLKESLDGLSNRDINAYEELMYGLLLSGLAMQMTGHSRPASGAEHHMAHFWEMAVINDEIDAYHGEKVGVGLIQVSDIYHEAVKYLKEGNFKVKDHVDIETDLIEKTFTNKELCESIKKTNDPNLLDLIDPKILREKTEEIIRIIEEIPKADEIVAMLEKVHGVKSLEDIGFTPDMKEKTARVAPYIRDRITFMRILKFYDFYDDVIK